MPRHIPFVPKRPTGSAPWQIFGSDRATYEKWAPHICGICCVAMVAAHYERPLFSLWELTTRAIKLNVFRENTDEQIEGAFHGPLVTLAEELGLAGRVEPRLNMSVVRDNLIHGRLTLLSIDLRKVQQQLTGSHLILIHSILASTNDVVEVHDCAHTLALNGENVTISFHELERISNRKGVSLWLPNR